MGGRAPVRRMGRGRESCFRLTMINIELCDVVDKFRNRTGRIVTRGTELASDEFYLVVHVWIRDENNNYLIQQRALHLISDPGVWATTVGYVLAGEESIECAIREVKEELGIQLLPAQLKCFDRHIFENRVEDVWVTEISIGTTGTLVPGPEVADWKWISKFELEDMVNRGNFFRYSYYRNLLNINDDSQNLD